MDEPFSALDPISRTNLQDLVLDLHNKLGNTIVFVTHNMNEALKLGDRIGVMNEGRLVQCDTPEKYGQSQKRISFAPFDETQGAQQEQRLQAIIDSGYYQQSTTQEGMSLDVKVPLSQVYEVLANHEHLVVTEQGQAIGEVSRTDIFHFLSQEEQDAKL